MVKFWAKYQKYIVIILIAVVMSGCVGGYFVYKDYLNYCKTAVPILEYHGIGSSDGWMQELFVPKETFEAQLQYLHQEGYTMISLEQLADKIAGGESLEKNVVMTFDDGYLDNYTNALTLLKQYDAKGTFFLVFNKIGHYRYMTRDQIQALIDNGMEIGSHTINHQILTDIKAQYLIWELATAKYFFKKIFDGYIIQSLSYPNGMYNEMVLEAVKDAKYRWAVTGKTGAVTAVDVQNRPLRLGRVYITDAKESLEDFKYRLNKAYWYGYFQTKLAGFASN